MNSWYVLVNRLTSDYQTTPRMFPSGFVLSQGINPAADDFCDLWTTSLWNYWTGLESNGCSRPTCNISHNCQSGPRARTELSAGPILSQHQTRRDILTAGPFPEPVLRDATFAGEILNTTGEIDIVLQLCTAHRRASGVQRSAAAQLWNRPALCRPAELSSPPAGDKRDGLRRIRHHQ